MTDRELIEQWLRPGAIVPVNNNAVRVLLEALRDRLAQPEWVGLTDEEIDAAADEYEQTDFAFARAIEYRLKEKNT
jgi:hypothetical protein